MKLRRILIVTLLVLTSFGLALADNAPDPHVKTGGGGGLAPTSAPAAIIVQNFTIESPSGTSPGTSPCILIQGSIMTTSPQCLFENDITLDGVGLTISSLIFDAPGIAPSTVTCGFLVGSPFSQCGVDPLGSTGTQVTFFNGTIPFHGDFSLDFELFPQNFNFGGSAVGAPEPAAWMLCLVGLVGLLVRRRSLRRA